MPRLSQSWLWVALSLPILLGAGPDFQACGGDTTPVAAGGGLPVTEPECFIDSDCTAEICITRRCIARRCVDFGAVGDSDGDTFLAEPCGIDCNDTDSTVNPNATESCNRRDDDCDGLVDEGVDSVVQERALGLLTPFLLRTADDVAAVAVGTTGNPILTLVDALPVLTGPEFGEGTLLFAAGVPAMAGGGEWALLTNAGPLGYQRFRASEIPTSVFGPESIPARSARDASLTDVGGTTVVFHEDVLANRVSLTIPGAEAPFFTTPGAQDSRVVSDGIHAVIRNVGALLFVGLDGTVAYRHPLPDFLPPVRFASGVGKVYIPQRGGIFWVTATGESGALQYAGESDEIPTIVSGDGVLYAHMQAVAGPLLVTYDLADDGITGQFPIATEVGDGLQATTTDGQLTALVESSRSTQILVEITNCDP